MNLKVNERGYVYDADPNPMWLPPINLKQLELFNCFGRYTLVDGPRKCSKTYGLIHRVLRHGFDVDNDMFAIVNKTLKNAKSSGVWTLLCNWMIPFWEHGAGNKWEPWMPEMWKHGCPGFKVLEGPKTTGDTKLSFVKIRNRHGGVSEIQAHSLEHAQEVEAKFKGPFYSGFWCSEGDQYMTRHALDILSDALRAPGVKYEDHQIFFDCNPPDTGKNNWMWKLWFDERLNPPINEEDFDPIFHEGLHRIGFNLSDNPQLDDKERRELIARYKKRKGLYDRFILGIWTEDVVDGFFSECWDEDQHVFGKAEGQKEDWEVIVPTPQCTTLVTGWDIGDRSHAFRIMEKITTEAPDRKSLIVSFNVIDELDVFRSKVSTTKFCLSCLERMDYWQKYQKETNKIDLSWRHWSDTSAWNFKASAGSYDAAIVYEATAGRIALRPAPKYRDSNEDKVALLREFLHLKRIAVSAQLFGTRAMFANLRTGGKGEYVREDDFKHGFDALSYPLLAEAPIDMIKSSKEVPTAPLSRPVDFVVAGV